MIAMQTPNTLKFAIKENLAKRFLLNLLKINNLFTRL